MLITHENLTIRSAEAKDAPLLGAWWRDGAVMAHAGFPRGLCLTDEEIAVSLQSDADDTRRRLIIEADGIPVGEMSYRNKGNATAEIGIKICDFSKQNKGYGTRLLRMLCSALLDTLGYEKIILNANLNNARAQHVFEKLGFCKTGVRYDCWQDQLGRTQSAVDYELQKDAFLSACLSHWYAYIYDMQENYTHDVHFLLTVLGPRPQKVLEACCGTGRILIPIAQAGHEAVGFDKNTAMLARIPAKAGNLSNLCCYRADALFDGWGQDFDFVVLAGNIMLNIESDLDNKQAQRTFIQRAAEALAPGGHLYLDFDLSAHPERIFSRKSERVYFDGADDTGVYGRYIKSSVEYDESTQICRGHGRDEITLPSGEKHVFQVSSVKHIPTLAQIHAWLESAGFTLEWEYGGYNRNPIGESAQRAVILARKNT